MYTTHLGRIWDKLHIGKLSLFAAFSVADLLMTYELLRASGGSVYESNPVANAWLAAYDFTGLAVYKALAMFLVIASALYVAVHRPRLGGCLLGFAWLATATVVGYSMLLAFTKAEAIAVEMEEVDIVSVRGHKLDGDMLRQKAYQNLLFQLGCDLTDQRCRLTEAVERLRESAKAADPDWLAHLRRTHPGFSDEQCLAIHVARHALVTVQNNPPLMRATAEYLQSEFQTSYGNSYPFELAAAHLAQDADSGTPSRRTAVSLQHLTSHGR